MAVEHPIADMITRIENAGAVDKSAVEIPYSNMKHEVSELLAEEGFVDSVEKKGSGTDKRISVALRYDDDGDHVIHETEVISGPERRIYFSVDDIRPVKRGRGRLVITTPNGVLTGQSAKEENVGGEPLFLIW
ncbi:MAG: 30S ribosomal protein S8 [Parcubacteria group bacterium SW_4_46_8]|nr:MAG: 30S ribosomal protein S8 [Parcubacteria group bacterium SW_4_46_8]